MPYIDRNGLGHIVGIYAMAQRPNQEWVESAELYVDPAVLADIAKTKADADEAKADNKLLNITRMSPTQARAWVATNVNNLADAKDAIATLAVAVCILSRRL